MDITLEDITEEPKQEEQSTATNIISFSPERHIHNDRATYLKVKIAEIHE